MRRIKEVRGSTMIKLLLASLLTFHSIVFALETLPVGKIGALDYSSDGVSFKVYDSEGIQVSDSGACSTDKTYLLPTTHTNYDAVLGALVSAQAFEKQVVTTLDGCTGTLANVTRVRIGSDPVTNPTPVIQNLMDLSVTDGNGISLNVNSGIDTVANEAMVLTKSTTSNNGWSLFDTQRGATKRIAFNQYETTQTGSLTEFNSTGHAFGNNALTNASGQKYLNWTMMSEAGFFDVVRYTGDGTNRTINHNLNAEVGMIWVKNLTTSSNDYGVMWHKSFPSGRYINLASNLAAADHTGIFTGLPTNTTFTVGASVTNNKAGDEYVAYIFAHNPTKEIFVGSYSGTGATTKHVTGFKPELIILRDTTGQSGGIRLLSSAMETSNSWKDVVLPFNGTAPEYFSTPIVAEVDGFTVSGSGNWSGSNIIYMAIGAPTK